MMFKAAYFPTMIYAKDVNLDNRLFEKEVIEEKIKTTTKTPKKTTKKVAVTKKTSSKKSA